MPDIYHDFPIVASQAQIFQAISSPEGLSAWWTKRAAGRPDNGEIYQFWFAPEYDWRGCVTKYDKNERLEWEIVEADEDWTGTLVGFQLIPKDGYTQTRFYHTGWKDLNDHFRRSSYCWAMYLRVMKIYIEEGRMVPYENRQDPGI